LTPIGCMVLMVDIELTRLPFGLYCLPRQQEIVMSVATAKIKTLHNKLKK
jgi:hypothetical protein